MAIPSSELTAGAFSTRESSLISWTQAIYALHAFSLVMGIVGVATIVGAFLTGWPSLIAVVLNYVKRSEVRGTWLESHFRWQIRTSWYALLWAAVGLMAMLTIIGFFVALGIWFVTGIWTIYRIVKGWLALKDGRPMYGG